jgi:hypothetical protein
MQRVPMPSPRGTNYANKCFPASWPLGNPTDTRSRVSFRTTSPMAMDAMPSGRLNPEAVQRMLAFVAPKLSPQDLDQVRRIVASDASGSMRQTPLGPTPATHGGNPSSPGWGDRKDYGALRGDVNGFAQDGRPTYVKQRAPNSFEAMFPEAAKIGVWCAVTGATPITGTFDEL